MALLTEVDVINDLRAHVNNNDYQLPPSYDTFNNDFYSLYARAAHPGLLRN